MTKTKEQIRVPEAVVRMMQIAREQRAIYARNPDPLPVEPEIITDDRPAMSEKELLNLCAAEPETDIGNARRLIKRYGDKIMHLTHVGWHGYDGRRWQEDASGAVVRQMAHKTAEAIDKEAVMLECDENSKAIIKQGEEAAAELKMMVKPGKTSPKEDHDKWFELTERVEAMNDVNRARNSEISSRHTFARSAAGSNRINNMLAEAAPYVSRIVDDLNSDLYSLNCESGTLRFYRKPVDEKMTWVVRLDRHRSEDLISKIAETEFDAEARAPAFSNFLKKVMPDPDIRGFLRRYLGYSLLGITTEQCLLFFYGAGRNGKSTLIDLIVELLGDYAISMSIDSFAGDSRRAGAEATPDLARLPGARLVAASEPEMGVKLKDALIKSLTGGEAISVRRLHQDFFELHPQFKIILSGNHKPIIHDDSDGIWRRVHLVPFEIQIAEDEVDADLPRKLRMEKAGIFAWLVKGALEYLNDGLRVPDRVRAATAEYREESDPIGAYLRNGCIVTGSDEDWATPEDMFNGFCLFARREGLSEFKQATFSRRLPDQTRKMFKSPDGALRQFRKGKNGTTIYYGIRIKPEFAGPPPRERDDPGY